MLNALIFDVDGTLAETEEAHRKAFNQTFAEFGLDWHWDPLLYGRLLKVSGGKERMRSYAGANVDDTLIDALHRRKTEIYTTFVATGAVPLRPGIERLITQALECGLTLAVATTTTRANLLALLDGATGGAGHDWFKVLACADDAPIKKPDPAVYRFVLERLELPAVRCLAIEDTRNGVLSARGAGLDVVVTRSTYAHDEDVTGALAVYEDLSFVGLPDLMRLKSRMGWAEPPAA
ncbi:Protein CbbY, plasmid [Magnetospirillum sp. LM-5]|uniref:HAD-IA family hydrolase n=1 Tax=Magnetospirillum sp. LM-5 TaxID=2681466 RepID=UPI001381CADC|nr:HAD-IA family hydrolase [Magnetospirillum sp. LM-5]CAA7614999.1 Protein CbbY, plasmid [Magnetospirillum sp. LM-5]